MLEPLRCKNFRLLAIAGTVNYLGNGIAPIALSFAVLDLGDSVAELGIVVSARTIANIALLLFGGVLADRFPRALILRGSALLAACSQGILAVAMLSGFGSIPLLAGLGVVNGAASAASLPATSALLPQTVPSGQLRQANALARMGTLTASIAGAGIGGLLIAEFGSGWGLAIDAVSFLVVAILFGRLRVTSLRPNNGKSRPLAELRAGWREFTAHNWVWIITLDFLVVNAMMTGGIRVLGPVIADHTIGRAAWGFVLATQMVGSALGAIAAARWQPRRALLFGTAMTVIDAVPLLSLAHFPMLAVLLPVNFLYGLAGEQFVVAWEVSLQENIPADTLARVYSYDALGSFIAVPLGQLIIGPLAEHIGTSTTLNWAAGLALISTMTTVSTPSVRRLVVGGKDPRIGNGEQSTIG